MIERSRRILIADHEKDLVWALGNSLKEDGYEILSAYDGVHALTVARRHPVDLVILDIAMPGMNGLWVCRQLRLSPLSSGIPILFLTSLCTVEDKVNALDQGGDDYLVKPFDLRELKARIRALLRRGACPPEGAIQVENRNSRLESGSFCLKLETREAHSGDTAIKLTPRQFDLLHHFMANLGMLFSSEDLLQQVWGYPASSGCSGLVRWHIKSLRSKLDLIPNCSARLLTVRGHGYMLTTSASPPPE